MQLQHTPSSLFHAIFNKDTRPAMSLSEHEALDGFMRFLGEVWQSPNDDKSQAGQLDVFEWTDLPLLALLNCLLLLPPGQYTRFEVLGRRISRNKLIAESIAALTGLSIHRNHVSSKLQSVKILVKKAAASMEKDFLLATLEPEDDPVASKGEIEVPSPEALRLMGLDKVDVGILEERTAMREMLQKRKREGEDGEVKGEGEVKKQKRPRNLRRRVDALKA